MGGETQQRRSLDALADPDVLRTVRRRVVGRQRETEVLLAALATGRHVVLQGPPGTGKSTLLRAVAAAAELRLEFVEGNAELTPARLVGSHDPPSVMRSGYTAETFEQGPLLRAVEEGSLLYIEEFNRVPEETLNILMTVLAENEIHVARIGRIPAHTDFRLIAAMNPFDDVGTARVSRSISDRVCRIALGYQSEETEREVVRRETSGEDRGVDVAVTLVRATREDPRIRIGASVRGAIDMVILAHALSRLRDTSPSERGVLLDAALASLSGRITLEDESQTPEEIITSLLDRALAEESEPVEQEEPPEGKVPTPTTGEPGTVRNGS